jgi:hypothetical protein
MVLKTLGGLERSYDSYGTIFTFEELLKITSVYQRGTWQKKEVPDRNISEVLDFWTSRSIQLIVDAFFEDGIFERKFLFTFRPNQEQLRKMQL